MICSACGKPLRKVYYVITRSNLLYRSYCSDCERIFRLLHAEYKRNNSGAIWIILDFIEEHTRKDKEFIIIKKRME